MEAVATILSAVKVIAFSIRSLASVSKESTAVNAEPKKGSSLGIHKWILLAGAFVGVITIAYLECIAANSKPKEPVVQQKEHEKIETVYVTE